MKHIIYRRDMMSIAVITKLKDLLGHDRVHQDNELLAKRSTDTWPLKMVQKAVGATTEQPLCVVQPKSTKAVATLLQFLNEENIPAIPYGGRSGVNGGSQPNNESVIIDVGNMSDIGKLDEENLTVTTKPGIVHRDLKNYLNEHGYISGHYAQSIDFAQLEGLVAPTTSELTSKQDGKIGD